MYCFHDFIYHEQDSVSWLHIELLNNVLLFPKLRNIFGRYSQKFDRVGFYFVWKFKKGKWVWNWKKGAPTLILLTFTRNNFKNKRITFIRKDYENIYLSMSSVKIENSTLSLYIDDIGNRGPTKRYKMQK